MRKTRVHLPIAFGVELEGRKVKAPTSLPVLFSLGPIRNSYPWHGRAIARAVAQEAEIFFACPARPTELEAATLAHAEPDNAQYEVFPRQRAWENYYIDRAMGINTEEDTGGCGLFHLGAKDTFEKHPGKSYAQITMLEFGEMIATIQFFKHDLRVVVSYDPDFPELSTVLYELEVKVPQVPVFAGLDKGVDAAIAIALKSRKVV